MARRHWMDAIADDIRERVREAIPFVAGGLKDIVPVGYEPPKPKSDEVDAFLNQSSDERMGKFIELGSEGYQDYSKRMMVELTKRFGAAAGGLMPLLEATPMQIIAGGMPEGESRSQVA